MKLYLLRHAEAVDTAASDSVRELTAKGRKQAERVGEWCAHRGLSWDVVLMSPFVRTVETAAGVLAQMKNPPSAQPVEWLASGAHADGILAELSAYSRLESVLVIGHEPDLSLLAVHVMGAASGGSIRMRKASLLCLDITSLHHRAGTLDWLIPVKFMS